MFVIVAVPVTSHFWMIIAADLQLEFLPFQTIGPHRPSSRERQTQCSQLASCPFSVRCYQLLIAIVANEVLETRSPRVILRQLHRQLNQFLTLSVSGSHRSIAIDEKTKVPSPPSQLWHGAELIFLRQRSHKVEDASPLTIEQQETTAWG